MAASPERWIELSQRVLGDDPPRLEAVSKPAEDAFSEDDLQAYRSATADDAPVFEALLAHPIHRHLIKLLVLHTFHVPEWIVRPLLVAAADTIDPSFNKHFIIPCSIRYGRKRVMGELVHIAMTSADARKAGAINALYWASMRRSIHLGNKWDYSLYKNRGKGPFDDPLQSFAEWAVREFIDNPSVNVRRALVSRLAWRCVRETTSIREAIEIARAHPDPYIRRRVRYGLGEADGIPCLPHRETD